MTAAGAHLAHFPFYVGTLPLFVFRRPPQPFLPTIFTADRKQTRRREKRTPDRALRPIDKVSHPNGERWHDTHNNRGNQTIINRKGDEKVIRILITRVRKETHAANIHFCPSHQVCYTPLRTPWIRHLHPKPHLAWYRSCLDLAISSHLSGMSMII